ncbi:snRNA-activating protein of 50kDa MW C terminal-domain-containing protein [Dichotomocladium elegans]|nr:snRNA-activating protein of 50kDa MW C terminal-domain-containing protein [Dichotomocladium elegans]
MKINVREFRVNCILNRAEQRKQEKSIRMKRLADRVGDLPPVKTDELNAASEVFVDATLFSMILERSRIRRREYSRVRVAEDSVIKRKPQAKDVLPNRTLLDQEEETLRDLESEIGDNMFLNPIVPKRRKYLTDDKIPRLLKEIVRPQEDQRNDRAVSANKEADTAFRQGHLLAKYLHPELAIPLGNVEEVEDEEDDGTEGAEDGEGQQSLGQQADDEEPDPSIPQTERTKFYREVIKDLNESTLLTLNPKNMVDLMPRHRCRLNYAALNQRLTEDAEKSKGDPIKADSEESVCDDEVVLTISFYHPYMVDQRVREFLMLGSQPLTDFRDAIFCLQDFVDNCDHKDRDPDKPILNSLRKKTSGSCFYIDDMFYIDTRAAEEDHLEPEPDYSETIRKWATERKLPRYTSHRSMRGVTFEDLEVEIGKPYLFIHQHNCQHLFMIRDIRIHSKQDPKLRSEYPKMTYNGQFVRHKCTMCAIYPADFMTFDDIFSGSSPAFFCKRCYVPFHFDKDGNRVYNFTSTKYVGL